MSTKARSNTILAAIGTVVGVLVIVGVILALQPPPKFDPGTPEAAAQGYYEAVLDDDDELAASYMTDELKRDCNGEFWYRDTSSGARIVITRSEVDGERAELDVTIETSYGEGPFGGGSYDQDETVVLELRGDRWLISEPTWPMDEYRCRRVEA